MLGSNDIQSLAMAADPVVGARCPRPGPARNGMPRLGGWWGDGLCLGLLAAVFLASVLAVGPGGDFPLNDDWSFATSVRTLVAARDWRPSGWASMTQISHALLGYAVCSLSSCSFEHLRATTLVAALALLLGCFGLFRRNGGSRCAAALAACAIVFNPVLYPLTYTFMTDVGFALLLVASAPACLASLRTGRWRDVLLSTALLLAATLSRQLGIAMAAALLPLHLLASREPLRIRLVKAGMPVAVCLGALLACERWMRQTGRLPALYDEKYAELAAALEAPGHLLASAVINLLVSGLYLGLVCLPVLLLRPIGREPMSVLRGAAGRWATVSSIAAVVLMVRNRTLMPLLGNVLGRGGVGPFTLRDTYILGLPDVPELPVAFWVAMTGFSLLGFWLLVFHLLSLLMPALRQVRAGKLDVALASRCFGPLATGLYLVPLLPGGLYDRYVVVMAPVLCLCLVSSEGRSDGRSGAASGRDVPKDEKGAREIPAHRRASRRLGRPSTLLACLYAGCLGTVSVLATHDYLAWNRARWDAIGSVEADHEGDAATMDGGFEYNGYRSYDRLYNPTPTKSWWWIADDVIQIGFGPMPGTDVLRRYAYQTWLLPDTRSIVVLRRRRHPAAP